MSTIKCARCNHYHIDDDDTMICTLKDCMCDYERFMPEIQKHTLTYYQQAIASFETMEEKIKYLLAEIKGFRDLNDKEFTRAYQHYVHDFKIGDVYTMELFQALPTDGLVTRARRRVVVKYPQLKGNENRQKFTAIKEMAAMEWSVS